MSNIYNIESKSKAVNDYSFINLESEKFLSDANMFLAKIENEEINKVVVDSFKLYISYCINNKKYIDTKYFRLFYLYVVTVEKVGAQKANRMLDETLKNNKKIIKFIKCLYVEMCEVFINHDFESDLENTKESESEAEIININVRTRKKNSGYLY